MNKKLFGTVPVLLLMADPPAGGSGPATPPPGKPQSPADRITRLESELSIARDTIATFEAEKARRNADEVIIATKIQAGLTRPQAIAVIERQRAHDKGLEAEWAARRPQIVDILKSTTNAREQRQLIKELNPAITVDEINLAKKSIARAAK